MWLLTYKLIRPILPISSGIAVWIIAQFCNANFEQSLVAAIATAINTVGASIYHYGGANWMYARKDERYKFKDPELVRLMGLEIFCLSISIAVMWLPKICALICLFNTLVIAAYSAKLSSHWITKNITMSIICVTPILMGWQVGTINHPIIFWSIGLAGIAYFAREVIKDVKDIVANEGKRVTLPMILGKEQALQIAGGLLVLATVLLFGFMQFTKGAFQIVMVGTAAMVFIITAKKLLVNKKAGKCETLIQLSICLILLALV